MNDTLIFGILAYFVTYSIMIYYKMVIKRVDREWLKIYIPLTTILFIICVVAGFYFKEV